MVDVGRSPDSPKAKVMVDVGSAERRRSVRGALEALRQKVWGGGGEGLGRNRFLFPLSLIFSGHLLWNLVK